VDTDILHPSCAPHRTARVAHHERGEAYGPTLAASDIPWGVGGLSVGFVEDDDLVSYRTLTHEAIHALARVVVKLQRANAMNRRLREELRRHAVAQMDTAA
jgi:hypothetical protein